MRIAFFCLVCSIAFADRLEKAEREMQRAHQLMDAHDYPMALQHFEAARQLAPESSGPYLGIGLSWANLDRCDRAIPALEEYLRRKTSSPSPAAAPALQSCRARMRPPPPRPEPTLEKGAVHVEGLPIGAEVRVDTEYGEATGRMPVDLSLSPGPHTLTVSHPGYRAGRFEVNVVAGVSLRLPVQLEIPPPPPPPAPPRGRLEVFAGPPPVSVILNGARMPGTGPSFGAELPAGIHRIIIEKQGYNPEYRDVLVRPNEKIVQKHNFPPKMSLKRKRVVAAVAVLVPLAAVALAVGLGVGLTENPPAEAPRETFLGTLHAP